MTNRLTVSSAIDARLAHSPARYTRLPPSRRARLAPSSDAATAVITCGTNMMPYWLLVSP
jgi:hypothetical protein